MNNLPTLSIYQPSLNQCLISNKYYSEAVPEFGHLSIPPGFILKDFKHEIYHDSPLSSTIRDVLIKRLVNKVNPESNTEIIEINSENITPDKKKTEKTKKKSKKSRKKNNFKKKSKQTKKK